MQKKVLVVGQGAREHALAWKLSQSPLVGRVFVAPGNDGMISVAERVDIPAAEVKRLLEWAQQQKIDLTVVGPEVPLLDGLADAFRAAGLAVFGPSAAAAALEGSKVFAKRLFHKYHIPTAEFEVFTDAEAAAAYAQRLLARQGAVVIKADGLAAGKGVVIAASAAEINSALHDIMQAKIFGASGNKVVVEEFLEGPELSFFAVSDGQTVLPLLSAQDHKKIYTGDKGPNTGGMGAYVNPPFFDAQLQESIMRDIIRPTLRAMEAEGRPYQGVLYAGLIITPSGPKVLEYNVRFGDPEAQVLIPMLNSDLFVLLKAAAEGGLADCQPEFAGGSCVCVVMASAGYPLSYETGKVITGLNAMDEDVLVFHAGTKLDETGNYVTAGGRVLSVVSRGESLSEAVSKVYAGIKKLDFAGAYYRADIAAQGLQ